MSAPAPRPGSSGRCGKSGSSPVTSRSASTGSVPGRDPTPEAGPHGVGTGLRSVLSGSPPGLVLSAGSSAGEDTTTTVSRRHQDDAPADERPTETEQLSDGRTGVGERAAGRVAGGRDGPHEGVDVAGAGRRPRAVDGRRL